MTKVLIVDDNVLSLNRLTALVSSFGYEPITATNESDAFELCGTSNVRTVIAKAAMNGSGGLDLCRKIRSAAYNGYVYVMLLTDYNDHQSAIDCLDAGADNYVLQPINHQELRLQLLAGQRLVALESRDLIIFSMAKLAESRDTDTGKHLERIQEYCRVLAIELSKDEAFEACLDSQYIQLLQMTSPLHDIGKVGIPDRVLLKPGKLNEEEFEIMKTHAELGGLTLQAAADAYPEAKFLKMAVEVAVTHHEKWNGTGYPKGLRGEDIPLSGRVVAVADVYDALRAKRVYKPAFSHDEACRIIRESSGSHFDPRIVDAFLRIENKFDLISQQLAECIEPICTEQLCAESV
jgi:putative two-component system response regulator